jgi:hypothetical protein
MPSADPRDKPEDDGEEAVWTLIAMSADALLWLVPR